MNTNSTHGDEILEILLRDALISKYKNEVNEVYSDNSEYAYSDSFDKKIKSVRRGINRTRNIKTAFRVFKKAAVAVASVMGIIFGGLMTQHEVSASVYNVVTSAFSDHDNYTVNNFFDEYPDFNSEIRLGYVPDDYVLRSVYYSDYDIYTVYESSDCNTINFDYGIAKNSSISIDNERHVLSEITSNGQIYYFYQATEENDYNILLWYDGDYYFSIDALLDSKTLVKIAENIKK